MVTLTAAWLAHCCTCQEEFPDDALLHWRAALDEAVVGLINNEDRSLVISVAMLGVLQFDSAVALDPNVLACLPSAKGAVE